MFTYSQLLEYILEKCIFVSVLKSSSRDAKNKAHIKVAQFLLVESEDQLTDYGQSCGDLRKHKVNVCNACFIFSVTRRSRSDVSE